MRFWGGSTGWLARLGGDYVTLICKRAHWCISLGYGDLHVTLMLFWCRETNQRSSSNINFQTHYSFELPLTSSQSMKMFRIAVVKSARSAARAVVRTRAPILRSSTTSPLVRSTQFPSAASFQAVRYYSAPAGLAKHEVEGRIVDLLKNFDKVNVVP